MEEWINSQMMHERSGGRFGSMEGGPAYHVVAGTDIQITGAGTTEEPGGYELDELSAEMRSILDVPRPAVGIVDETGTVREMVGAGASPDVTVTAPREYAPDYSQISPVTPAPNTDAGKLLKVGIAAAVLVGAWMWFKG